MDNLTHTMLGLAAGEAAVRLRARRAPKDATRSRAFLWTISALANNFPDLDFIYSKALSGDLGYLLHHRGHTHTFLLGPLQALALLAAVRLALRLRGLSRPRADWAWAAALALLGGALHVFFDLLNSYGVHPFWPFDSRWYFGDSLFIVEPALWLLLAPPLALEAGTRLGRGLLWGVFALAIALCVFTGYVPWQLALVATLGGLWFAGLASKLTPATRIALAWGLVVALVASFATVSASAKQRIAAIVAAQFPSSRLLDIALSPYPVNPLCWSVITVELAGPTYTARKAVFAPAERWLGAADCPELREPDPAVGPTFALSKPAARASHRPDLLWKGEFSAATRDLLHIRDAHCGAAAMLRFLRVPAWISDGAGSALLGDLRFDRARGLEFAERRFTDDACPRFVPAWLEPRRDLLGD